MKNVHDAIRFSWCLLVLALWTAPCRADDSLRGVFVVGVDLGELPWHGSFKPGITLGYHFNEYAYVGVIYQLADTIQRDASSFNAQASGLDGLVSSRERVSSRALLHVRLRPHRLAPFVSLGVVYNGRDVESLRFDARPRTIGEESCTGPLAFSQARPAGIAAAIGLGYGYTFDNGLELSVEWTGAPYAKAPAPELSFDAESPLAESARAKLTADITRDFRSSVFNVYHVFHLGAGYAF